MAIPCPNPHCLSVLHPQNSFFIGESSSFRRLPGVPMKQRLHLTPAWSGIRSSSIWKNVFSMMFGFVLSALTLAHADIYRNQYPLTVNEVPELRGYLDERWEANRANNLEPFDIDRYVRMAEERKHREWWWIGEQSGKWLESAVLSSAHSDPQLRAKAKSVLDRLIASQEPGGYLGITSKEVRSSGKPLRGMDPYELYFMLHGLIAAWEQWGDKGALDSARKLGDYFVANIGPGKAEFWPGELRPPQNKNKTLTGQSSIAGHSVHYSWEGTLLIDPMLRLAQVTKDARYVNWSRWVVNNIDRWSGWDSFSKLDRVADGTMQIQQVQPYVHSHTFQMNFLGFLRLYEITGDASYLRKVTGAWNDIASRQMYITGGVSVGEHYEAGHVKPVTGHVVETCATMSWLQVTQYLLELTGDVKYADAMEKLLWNHVFASQAIDGDSYRYHTAPNGVKPKDYFHGPDCCTSSGHRMVSLLPTFLYGKDSKGVFVNQYGASTAEVKLAGERVIRLRQDSDYPEKSTIQIKVEAAPSESIAIRLRIPSWCVKPQVWLNGQSVEGVKSGSYLAIERAWKAGDLLRLDLPMELKWVRSDSPWRTNIERLPGGEIMHKPVEGDTPPWALTRGPMVYVADTVWWNRTDMPAPPMIGDDLAVIPDLAKVHEVPKPGKLVGPVFEAGFVTGAGKEINVPMVPFTNIGQWYLPDHPKPDRNSAAYSYAVWFLDGDSPVFREKKRQSDQFRDLITKSVDHILIGNKESEASHQVKGGNVGSFKGRNYRHGKDFTCVIGIPQGRDAKLIVTYWGGDANREFDIFADDLKIGTQRLRNQKLGEFFDESYRIPASLIGNRTDAFGQKVETVTVRFKSLNKDVAGGVYFIRTE